MDSFLDLGIFIEDEKFEEIIQVVEEKVIKNNPKVTAKADKVGIFGEFRLTFSESMFRNSSDLSWIDDSVINLQIIPFDLPEDIHPDMLSFEWKVIKFEGAFLDFKIKFTNSTYISLGLSQDILVITLNELYFLANATSEPLDAEYRVLKTTIPK